MSLFTVDGSRVGISPELQKIEAFRILIARDKDKAKRNASNELAYVYFIADYKSPYLVYSEKERVQKLSKDLRLGENWKPDKDVNNAIDKYRELNETPTMRTLRIMKETLTTTVDATQSLRDRIEVSLERYRTDEKDNNGGIVDITTIISAVTGLLTLSEKIPKMITTLTSIEDRVKTESIGSRIVGGGSAGFFED